MKTVEFRRFGVTFDVKTALESVKDELRDVLNLRQSKNFVKSAIFRDFFVIFSCFSVKSSSKDDAKDAGRF